MFGMGVVEILIIIAILVVLFGAPVITFLLGYSMGRGSNRPEPTECIPGVAEEDSIESAVAEEEDHE